MDKKVFYITTLLLFAILWFFIYFQYDYDSKQAIIAAETTATNLSKAFEENISGTLKQLDQFLITVRTYLPYNKDIIPELIKSYNKNLDRELILQVSIADANGMLIYSSIDSKPVDLRNREHIRVQLENKKDFLFISKPVLGMVSHKWSIQMTRKLFSGDGLFAGIIILSVNPEYFNEFYKSIDIGQGGVITLFGMDGVIRARSISSSGQALDYVGKSIDKNSITLDPAKPSAGIYHGESQFDGIRRIMAYRRLTNYPLVVFVGISDAEAFDVLRTHKITLIFLGSLASFFLLLALWLTLTLTSKQKRFTAGLQEMNAKLEVKSHQAEAANQAKSLFLANMSHEIRTPMHAILSITNLALKIVPQKEKLYSLLKTIVHSAENLLGLLNDILDCSKIEARQLILNETPFDFGYLIDSVLSTLQIPARNKGLRLEYMKPSMLPTRYFMGDELRLGQILLNLINNSIKFTDNGGITLQVTFEDQHSETGKYLVHFIVADTGIGISEEKISIIFDRFEQAELNYDRNYGGAGLGLFICRQLAELMGGRIWVESLINQGSSFHVVVPLSPCTDMDENLTAKIDTKAVKRKQIKDKRILVVDDNTINQEVASMMLARDHVVTTAGNGIEALSLLASFQFDLVLMDVQMPVMNGLVATSIIRAIERGEALPRELPNDLSAALSEKLSGKHLPIVAMTALAMDTDQEKCLRHGMDTYISKPFRPESLDEKLCDIFPNQTDKKEKPGEAGNQIVISEGRVTDVFPTLQQVRTYLGETAPFTPQQVEKLLQTAIESIGSNLDLAEEALARLDYSELGRAAHTLKGTLLQCGLVDWAEMAQEIHTGIVENKDVPYATMVDSLNRELQPLFKKAE